MLDRLDDALSWLNRFLVGALMLAMTLLVFANVVLRYLFGMSLPWVEEVTRYTMIWICYLGAGLALRAGTHVAVEVIQESLPKPLATALRAGIALMILAFVGSLTWYGIAYAQFAMRQTSPVLGLSLGMVYLAVPIGCALLGLHLLIGLRRYVLKDFELPAGAAESDPEILTLSTHGNREP